MPATLEAPPRPKDRNDYSDVLRLLAGNPGEWVKVPFAEVTGATPKKKQSALSHFAKSHGLWIQSTVQGEYVYVRLRRMDSSATIIDEPSAEEIAAQAEALLAVKPRTSTRRHKYKEFFGLVAANPGEWASLPVEDVGGRTNTAKAANIITCAKVFGLRVTTTIQDGRLYAKLVGAAEAQS